ncbi:MAG: hypothetical protein U9R60_02360 [Bacteroidota bacterium]|nr:hypothetical protein [Bacteroidota bacterium]
MKAIVYSAMVLLMISCNAAKVNSDMPNAQAPLIVYKTVADFYNNVPVTLNEAKDRIVSFPAPSDLFYGGELALPLKLNQGYLLDRRGIHVNSAFTSYTYEEYSRMESPPSLRELYDSIIAKEPFESIYDCGTRGQYNDLEKELKKEIRKGMTNVKPLTD